MSNTPALYLKLMLNGCDFAQIPHWEMIRPHAENEFRGLILIIKWLSNNRKEHSMSIEQARIHIDIHKNTMRTRLMALPGIDMIIAENIMNTAIDSIRKELYTEMDWVII